MIIGITGVVGSGKGRAVDIFKSVLPNDVKKKFFYVDIDEKIGNLLHIDTPTYNQLKDNLGEHWEQYEEKGIGHHYRCHKIMRNPEDYRIFMDTMRPYVTCKIAKIASKFYEEKDMIIFCNHLLDYEWAQFCDRIIVVSTSEENMIRRLKKKGVRDSETAKRTISQFLTNDELVQKADYVIHDDAPDVMRKEIKQMVKELLQFRQFINNGMIPSVSKETVEKNQKILDNCYATYAPQFAAAMAAKLIANEYGYDTGTTFTGRLENHRDIVGGPLEEGEVSHLTIEGRERRKRIQAYKAEQRALGIPSPKQVRAEERKKKEKQLKEIAEKKRVEEAKQKAERQREKNREKQKRRRQKKAAEKYGDTSKPVIPKKKTIIVYRAENVINTKKSPKPIDKK